MRKGLERSIEHYSNHQEENKMILINTTTKQPVQIGDQVETWAGSKVTVLGMTEPHKPSSTGRLYVKGLTVHGEYFPSVFNCEWVQEVTA